METKPTASASIETTTPMWSGKLLTKGNPKTAKGEAQGWLTAILHLSPHKSADGVHNMCSWATVACIDGCLNTAGRGGIIKAGETTNNIQRARRGRTLLFIHDRSSFIELLIHEIHAHIRAAARAGLKPAVRLNGTSDVQWEHVAPAVFAAFPAVRFYDYTKSISRATAGLQGRLPANYSLTLSRSETPDSAAACAAHVAAGGTACVVVGIKRGAPVPTSYMGMPTIDGDLSDLRFKDPAGHYVMVRAKGKAKADCSGFVVRTFEV